MAVGSLDAFFGFLEDSKTQSVGRGAYSKQSCFEVDSLMDHIIFLEHQVLSFPLLDLQNDSYKIMVIDGDITWLQDVLGIDPRKKNSQSILSQINY